MPGRSGRQFSAEDFVDNLTNEGTADVGGAETTKVSGDLERRRRAGGGHRTDRAPRLQLAARSAPARCPSANSKRRRAKSKKRSNPRAPRSTSARTRSSAASPPSSTIQPEGSDEAVTIEIDLTINGVNEEQEIGTPRRRQAAQRPVHEARRQPDRTAPGRAERRRAWAACSKASAAPARRRARPAAARRAGAGLDGAQSEYLECVQGASTPVDLQNCAKKLQ